MDLVYGYDGRMKENKKLYYKDYVSLYGISNEHSDDERLTSSSKSYILYISMSRNRAARLPSPVIMRHKTAGAGFVKSIVSIAVCARGGNGKV